MFDQCSHFNKRYTLGSCLRSSTSNSPAIDCISSQHILFCHPQSQQLVKWHCDKVCGRLLSSQKQQQQCLTFVLFFTCFALEQGQRGWSQMLIPLAGCTNWLFLISHNTASRHTKLPSDHIWRARTQGMEPNTHPCQSLKKGIKVPPRLMSTQSALSTRHRAVQLRCSLGTARGSPDLYTRLVAVKSHYCYCAALNHRQPLQRYKSLDPGERIPCTSHLMKDRKSSPHMTD